MMTHVCVQPHKPDNSTQNRASKNPDKDFGHLFHNILLKKNKQYDIILQQKPTSESSRYSDS